MEIGADPSEFFSNTSTYAESVLTGCFVAYLTFLTAYSQDKISMFMQC
jgi:hypothetical protein